MEDLNEAIADNREPKLAEGHYDSLEVTEVRELLGNTAGGSFIINALNDGRPCSITINGLSNPARRKLALGNIKAFLAAVSGTDASETNVTLKSGGMIVTKTWNEFYELTVKKNAAKGAHFSVSVEDKTSKMGQAYKRYAFSEVA